MMGRRPPSMDMLIRMLKAFNYNGSAEAIRKLIEYIEQLEKELEEDEDDWK